MRHGHQEEERPGDEDHDEGEARQRRREERRAKAQREPKAKRVSALDAAARVLQEKGDALNCGEMIEVMATKGYWKSPGGKTPAATLYSAILREIKVKGAEARFKKTERGKFERAK